MRSTTEKAKGPCLIKIENAEQQRNSSFFVRFIRNRVTFLCIIIIIIGLLASFRFDSFATSVNIKSILLNMSTEVIVAIGMMILLISGAFDLSVGSVFGLAGAIAGRLMYFYNVNVSISVLSAILICIAVGGFNGFLISKVGVNPLIVTLAMMGLIRGLVMLIAGSGIIGLPTAFSKITDNTIFGLRLPIWYMFISSVIFSLIVSRTVYFRKYFYIGSNERAAFLTGINIVRMRIVSFMIMSGLAGFAGIIFASRIESSMSTLGNGLELRVITACVIGGASLAGGQGTIPGAVIGTLFLALINNLMIIGKISTYWQSVVSGGILLAAVIIDAVVHRSRGTEK